MTNFFTEKTIKGPVIGLDEVGRGPLAGPVVSCGCLFNSYESLPSNIQIKDSKKHTPKQRKKLFSLFKKLQKDKILEFHLGFASVKEIDELNILEATKLSMKRVIDKFNKPHVSIIIDGNFSLNYKNINERSIIGGDKLSRGLTLEGLSVSYFLRSAKMPMYDTLMQMGRWFGYRMGFEDLCRLYTTDNVIKWFFHISVATEELRNTFRIMAAQGSTPAEFGLKVRTNPNLIITAKTKMRHSKIEQTSFSQEVEEIITFIKNDEIIQSNFDVASKLLKNIKDPLQTGAFKNDLHSWKNIYLWKNIKPEFVIEFLNKYKRFSEVRTLETAQHAKYIENLNNYDELTNWTICLHGSGSSGKYENICNKYNVNLMLRTPSNQRNEKKISLKVVTQPTDEFLGLEGEEIEEYKKSVENFNKTHNPNTDQATIIEASRRLARYHRSEKRGLLNLYPILGITNLSSYRKFRGYKNCKKNVCEKSCKKHFVEGHKDINKIDPSHLTKQPLMGFQISFPNSKLGERAAVEYAVNSVYAEHEFTHAG